MKGPESIQIQAVSEALETLEDISVVHSETYLSLVQRHNRVPDNGRVFDSTVLVAPINPTFDVRRLNTIAGSLTELLSDDAADRITRRAFYDTSESTLYLPYVRIAKQIGKCSTLNMISFDPEAVYADDNVTKLQIPSQKVDLTDTVTVRLYPDEATANDSIVFARYMDAVKVHDKQLKKLLKKST